MNVIVRRKYTLEFDVWEPLQREAEREMDAVIRFAKERMTHAGHLHIVKVTEERQ